MAEELNLVGYIAFVALELFLKAADFKLGNQSPILIVKLNLIEPVVDRFKYLLVLLFPELPQLFLQAIVLALILTFELVLSKV